MGEGDPRPRRPSPKPTARKPTVTSKLVSQKLPVTRMPAVLRTAAPGADKLGAPLISRTATLDDPLTTSLLAEVTRSRTVEVSPEQIDEARSLEPGDRAPGDREPGDREPDPT